LYKPYLGNFVFEVAVIDQNGDFEVLGDDLVLGWQSRDDINALLSNY